MFECSIHGRQGAIIACPHVVQAVKVGSAIAYSLAKHEALLGGELVCEICENRWSKATKDAEFELLATELQGLCGVCFDKWETRLK